MKKFLVLASLLVAANAQAFSGSITMGTNFNKDKDKAGQNVGLSISHPLAFGFGLWSWNGVGAVHEAGKDESRWGQSISGLDWSFKRMQLGATVKINWENDFKDESQEYGFKAKVKLW
jgi:hypothetical protein